LGAGILFHQSDNQVFKIEIDLQKEMPHAEINLMP